MKKFARRLTALLVVVAMTLTGLGAFAETPKVPSPADVYARGNTLKTEIDVQLDSDTIAGLLGMFTGGQGDAGTTALVTHVANAITKLKTTMLSTLQNASIQVGTDKGVLLSVQAKADESGGLAALDLLPGIHLSMPQEMMKSLLDSQASFQTPEIAQEALVPYTEAVNAYIAEKVLGPAKVEEGPHDIEGIAAFTTRYEFDITNALLGGLISSVTEVFRADTAMQQLVDEYLKSLNTAGEMSENVPMEGAVTASTTIKNSAELLAGLDEMTEQSKQEPDRVIANSRAYVNNDSGAYYVEVESPLGVEEPVLGTFASLGAAPAVDVRIELIVNSAAPTYGEPEPAPETPAEPQPVDWKAVRAAIADGTNSAATMASLNIMGGPDAQGANMESKVEATIQVMGMVIAIQVDGKAALQGDYAAEGTITLSALTPSPLMTVVYKLSEVAELPTALPEADKVVEMGDGPIPEDTQEALNASLMQGLPMLMERLQTALPEEAPTLVTLLQQMMAQPEAPPAP